MFKMFICIAMIFSRLTFASGLITVFGLQQVDEFKTSDENTHFQVQLGAFKSHKNAEKCRKDFERRAQVPVKILPPKEGHGIYLVMMGPFNGFSHLQKVSQTLLGHDSPMPVKAVEIKQAEKGLIKNRIQNERMAIESRNRSLHEEVVRINRALQEEEDENRRIALSKRKKEINLELSRITQTVIQRISVAP